MHTTTLQVNTRDLLILHKLRWIPWCSLFQIFSACWIYLLNSSLLLCGRQLLLWDTMPRCTFEKNGLQSHQPVCECMWTGLVCRLKRYYTLASSLTISKHVDQLSMLISVVWNLKQGHQNVKYQVTFAERESTTNKKKLIRLVSVAKKTKTKKTWLQVELGVMGGTYAAWVSIGGFNFNRLRHSNSELPSFRTASYALHWKKSTNRWADTMFSL